MALSRRTHAVAAEIILPHMAGPSKAGMTAPMNERPRDLNLPAISRMFVFRLEKHSFKRSELCKICAK